MPLVIIGLDFETSHNDLVLWEDYKIKDGGARPIQIGVSFSIEDTFVSYIGQPEDEMVWHPQAAAIHNIPKETILSAPAPDVVDDKLFAWIKEQCGDRDPERSHFLTPCGWNVGAYDMPFALQSLPRTHSILSRRTIDLNSVCMSMDKLHKVDGSKAGRVALKKRAKAYAASVLTKHDINIGEHDAGYDAQQALLCLEYLRSVQAGKPLPIED